MQAQSLNYNKSKFLTYCYLLTIWNISSTVYLGYTRYTVVQVPSETYVFGGIRNDTFGK